MSEISGNIFLVSKLACALFLCGLLSLGVYLLAVPLVYAVWHCPPPSECNTPLWMNAIILFIFLSPLLIFASGAYFCREIIVSLTGSKILRAAVFTVFALFPLFVFGGLIAYLIRGAGR